MYTSNKISTSPKEIKKCQQSLKNVINKNIAISSAKNSIIKYNSKNSKGSESRKYDIKINSLIKQKMTQKYNCTIKEFNRIILEYLLHNADCHLVSIFKERMLLDYVDEFLRRQYNIKESKERIPKFSIYYKNYLLFFCKPTFRNFGFNELLQDHSEKKAEIYYKDHYHHEKTLNDEEDNGFEQSDSEDSSTYEYNFKNTNGQIFNRTIKSKIDNATVMTTINTTNNNTINLNINNEKIEVFSENKCDHSNDTTIGVLMDIIKKEKIKKNSKIIKIKNSQGNNSNSVYSQRVYKKNNTRTELRQKTLINDMVTKKNNFLNNIPKVPKKKSINYISESNKQPKKPLINSNNNLYKDINSQKTNVINNKFINSPINKNKKIQPNNYLEINTLNTLNKKNANNLKIKSGDIDCVLKTQYTTSDRKKIDLINNNNQNKNRHQHTHSSLGYLKTQENPKIQFDSKLNNILKSQSLTKDSIRVTPYSLKNTLSLKSRNNLGELFKQNSPNSNYTDSLNFCSANLNLPKNINLKAPYSQTGLYKKPKKTSNYSSGQNNLMDRQNHNNFYLNINNHNNVINSLNFIQSTIYNNHISINSENNRIINNYVNSNNKIKTREHFQNGLKKPKQFESNKILINDQLKRTSTGQIFIGVNRNTNYKTRNIDNEIIKTNTNYLSNKENKINSTTNTIKNKNFHTKSISSLSGQNLQNTKFFKIYNQLGKSQ